MGYTLSIYKTVKLSFNTLLLLITETIVYINYNKTCLQIQHSTFATKVWFLIALFMPFL